MQRHTVQERKATAEPGFSAAASFGISASTGFQFGLHQGILIGGDSVSAADLPICWR